MYPKNAASPEPVAIGAVVQISDGAVQTSGCTVRIKPIGVAEGDGAGTTSYSTDGIVYYTPTQAETNYTSFILIAKKTGCIPVSVTVVTSGSATAGHAAIDWGVVANKTTTNTLTGTTIATTQKVDVETIKTNPVVNAGTVTFPTSATLASTTNITAAAGCAVSSIGSGVITATSIAADAITAAKLAADVTTELQSGLATASALSTLQTAVNTIDDFLDTEIAAILADTNELQTDWADGGRLDLILDSAAGDPWNTSLPGAYAAGKAGYILGTNLDALISSRMATYTQPTGFLAATFPTTVASTTNITAGTITTVTNLTNLPSIPNNWLTAAGIAADAFTAAKFAADVTTEFQSGLATASALSTLQAAVDAIDDYVDTEVSAIKTVTDRLNTSIEPDGSVYRFTTNALEQAPTGSGSGLAFGDAVPNPGTSGTVGEALRKVLNYLDAAVSSVSGSAGSGGITWDYYQYETDGTTPIADCGIWVTTDSGGTNVVAGTVYTDAFGKARFFLDAGTYYIWKQKAGYTFTNPDTEVVS